MSPKLRIIAVILFCSAASVAVADKSADYQRRWARMTYVENTIREVDVLLARLEKSLLNLRLPSAQAKSIFAEEVLLHDLDAATNKTDADLETEFLTWPVALPQTLPRESLRIWPSFLETLIYLKYAELAIVDGSFSDARRSKFVAEVKFAGLGRTIDGQTNNDRLLHAVAKLELTFERDVLPASKPSSWRLHGWKTKSFRTVARADVMFQEVLDSMANPSAVASLRRSFHEELSAKIVLAKTAEEKLRARPFPSFDLSSWMSHPGLSVVDYNGDGFDDLFITRRTGPNTLLRNNGDGTFENATKQSALTIDAKELGFTNTALFADFDNDGDQDAFVGRSMYRSRYYENQHGKFIYSPDRVSITLPAHVVSISAVDYNNDGLLDVYLSRYLPPANGFTFESTGMKRREAVASMFEGNLGQLTKAESRAFAQRTWAAQADLFRDAPGLPNLLLKNIGDGNFELAKEGKSLEVWRPTYQSTWSDYDGDGDADVYIANDFSPNHLFRNDGGKFTDVTASTGTADNGFGMGASWGDYDGDGKLDLYVTNMSSKAGRRITKAMGRFGDQYSPMASGNTLYRQIESGFVRTSGTKPGTLPVETAGWGWGSQFMDIDNDGDLDIFAPAGYYTAPPEARLPFDT